MRHSLDLSRALSPSVRLFLDPLSNVNNYKCLEVANLVKQILITAQGHLILQEKLAWYICRINCLTHHPRPILGNEKPKDLGNFLVQNNWLHVQTQNVLKREACEKKDMPSCTKCLLSRFNWVFGPYPAMAFWQKALREMGWSRDQISKKMNR